MPVHVVAEQVGRDVRVAKLTGKGIALVDDTADSDVAPAEVRVRNMVEKPVSVRIVQRPVLAELLPVVPTLDAVQHAKAADVGAVEQVSVAVEIEPPGVSAS